MGKLIFVIFLGALIYLLLRSRRQEKNHVGRRKESANQAEAMTECAYCRLHIPRSEGLQVGDNFYCCEEHRRLGGG